MSDHNNHPQPPRPQPGDTVIGFSDAEVAAIRETTAEGNRNPEQVVDAFVGDDGIQIDGMQVGPFTLGHFLFLERLQHPVAESAQRPMTNMETATVIYVLCRPIKDSRKILAQGRESFDEAVESFSDTIPFRRLSEYGKAIQALMVREFATVTGDSADDSKKKMDTTPPRSPTDSAGA